MQTLTILSQKGGSGKSTLTVHLAVCAMMRGLKTVILDIDQQGSANRWNQIRAHDRKVDLAKIQAEQIALYLTIAKNAHADLVLIDTAPHSQSDGAIAAQFADFVLIPCRPAMFDLEAIFSTVQIAKTAKKPFAVILNAAPRGKLADECRAFLEKNSVPVLAITVHQWASLGHALFDGRSVHEFEPDGKATAEIEALYSHLFDQPDSDKKRIAA